MRRTLLGALVASLAASVVAADGRAQAPDEPPAAELFTARDWALVGGLIAAQVALLPLDEDVRRSTGRMRSNATDALSDVLRPLGGKDALYIGSVAAYALGRAAQRERLADVGLHALVSLALANAVTGTLKGLAGRARPWVLEVQGTDSLWVYHGPGEWSAFAGWTDGGPRQAYPSGHTTAAFAVAAVLAEELGGAAPWLAYPIAAGVGWSRLNDEAHWTTDVIMGALVGIVSGRLVVRYGHGRGSWLERTLLFEPSAGGTMIGARLPVGR